MRTNIKCFVLLYIVMEIYMKQIKIFDTTLRDGEQSPGCSMNLQEKLEVARALEKLKVDVMEAGFAISSPGDFESVKSIAEMIKDCSVASLSRCTEKDIDTAYEAVKGAVEPRIHLFLATSPVHMEYKLKMTTEQVLEKAAAMVAYASKKCSNIEFSAEDAMRSEPEFLAKVVEVAIKNGAKVVNIPDTVGYVTPAEMQERIEYLIANVSNADKAEFSVHCHNDLGMAVANSLAGVRGGATQIECTINGIGERAGNTSLEEVVMAMHTRPDLYGNLPRINTTRLYRTSKLVYNIIGQTVPLNKPIVGPNAFAHESGIHQHGVLANKNTYEILTPESVGIKTNSMILGKHSGKHALQSRLNELGYEVTEQDLAEIFVRFKDLCDKKKSVTDSDIEALVNNQKIVENKYKLERFDVHAGNQSTATCTVRLRKEDETFEEVAKGDGPIDAACRAIDMIVCPPEHIFEKYTINSTSQGKDTLGEVVVKLKVGDDIINGRGVSTDIIEASILAYLNAVNKLS